jgi:hypothetical protein
MGFAGSLRDFPEHVRRAGVFVQHEDRAIRPFEDSLGSRGLTRDSRLGAQRVDRLGRLWWVLGRRRQLLWRNWRLLRRKWVVWTGDLSGELDLEICEQPGNRWGLLRNERV